jgi:hypothetical protein
MVGVSLKTGTMVDQEKKSEMLIGLPAAVELQRRNNVADTFSALHKWHLSKLHESCLQEAWLLLDVEYRRLIFQFLRPLAEKGIRRKVAKTLWTTFEALEDPAAPWLCTEKLDFADRLPTTPEAQVVPKHVDQNYTHCDAKLSALSPTIKEPEVSIVFKQLDQHCVNRDVAIRTPTPSESTSGSFTTVELIEQNIAEDIDASSDGSCVFVRGIEQQWSNDCAADSGTPVVAVGQTPEDNAKSAEDFWQVSHAPDALKVCQFAEKALEQRGHHIDISKDDELDDTERVQEVQARDLRTDFGMSMRPRFCAGCCEPVLNRGCSLCEVRFCLSCFEDHSCTKEHRHLSSDMETSQAEWIQIDGLPDIEGESILIETSSKATLEDIQRVCAKNTDCVGFAFRPATKQWFPKMKGTGFLPSIATYSQKHMFQTWEWHYMPDRTQADIMVSGAGGVGAPTNGRYTQIDVWNDKPKFKHVSEGSIIYFDGGAWYINDEDDTTAWLYKASQSETAPLCFGEWTTEGYDGGDADPPPIVTQARLMEPDDVVVATSAFMSNSKLAAAIPTGSVGVIVKIDDDGDAYIDFDGLVSKEWVKKCNWKFLHVQKAIVQ